MAELTALPGHQSPEGKNPSLLSDYHTVPHNQQHILKAQKPQPQEVLEAKVGVKDFNFLSVNLKTFRSGDKLYYVIN